MEFNANIKSIRDMLNQVQDIWRDMHDCAECLTREQVRMIEGNDSESVLNQDQGKCSLGVYRGSIVLVAICLYEHIVIK
jgi:hypothetical protein